MKTKSILTAALSICLISGSAFGQEREEVKTVKKEIKKEFRVEEENGVKTLTISTDEDGVVTEEVYTGAAADKKMAEMTAEMEDPSKVQERVEVRIYNEINGTNEVTEKKVTITKMSNGEETIEVYVGEEAEAKIKELEGESEIEVITEEEVVVKKKVKRDRKRSTKKKDIME